MEAESSTGQSSNDAGFRATRFFEVPEIPGLGPGAYDMAQMWRDLYLAHLDGNAWPLGAGPRNPSFRVSPALTCDTYEVRLTLGDHMGGFQRLCYLEPEDARTLARELERVASIVEKGRASDAAHREGRPC